MRFTIPAAAVLLFLTSPMAALATGKATKVLSNANANVASNPALAEQFQQLKDMQKKRDSIKESNSYRIADVIQMESFIHEKYIKGKTLSPVSFYLSSNRKLPEGINPFTTLYDRIPIAPKDQRGKLGVKMRIIFSKEDKCEVSFGYMGLQFFQNKQFAMHTDSAHLNETIQSAIYKICLDLYPHLLSEADFDKVVAESDKLVIKAKEILKSGDNEQAMRLMIEVISINPYTADNYLLMCELTSNFAQQNSYYSHYLILKPLDYKIRYKLAANLFAAKMYQEAANHFTMIPNFKDAKKLAAKALKMLPTHYGAKR